MPLSRVAPERLQRAACAWFLGVTDGETGLVPDHSGPGAPVSVAAVGFALTSLVVAAARGWVGRVTAAASARRTITTFVEHGEKLGRHGLYYHFLNLRPLGRHRRCEVSTIDTAILLAGVLAGAAYFDRDMPDERAIREGADRLDRRADWRWALAGGETLSHGWRPERGFLRARWAGYSEALLLYVLALGSPTRAIPVASWNAWCRGHRRRRIYGVEALHSGPLFVHQTAHVWLGLDGLQDRAMRKRETDYFDNSRRAIAVQRLYAERNPRRFRGYDRDLWGLSASGGPGPGVARAGNRSRRTWGYRARGAPWGPDDGTLAPWTIAAALPFEPAAATTALERLAERFPEAIGADGLLRAFNPTFAAHGAAWVDATVYGIDQGLVASMIENHRSELVWRLLARSPTIVNGLRRAGFRGGWLDRSTLS